MISSTLGVVRIFALLLLALACFCENSRDLQISVAELKGDVRFRDDYQDITNNHLAGHKLALRYFDTVSKKMHLDDGRTITCEIPLIRAEETQWTQLGNLTKEQMESALIHFKDSCTRHRTKDFLWEFCYGKYFRQYDDALTIQNVNKPKAELFFLGFFDPSQSAKFADIITPETGNYEPEREYFDTEIRYKLVEESYIRTFRNMVRMSNISDISFSEKVEMLALEVYIPVSEIKNSSTVMNIKGTRLSAFIENDKLSMITKVIDGKKYYKLQRFIRVIASTTLLILDQPFPFDVATDKFDIILYGTNETLKDRFIPTELYHQQFYAFKNYVYGPALSLTQADTGNALLLIFNETYAEDRLIVSVLDDSLIELAESVENGPLKLKSFVTLPSVSPLLRSVRWTLIQQQIWLIGNVVLGNNTLFSSQFQRGDMLFLANFLEGVKKPTYAREILKVVNNNVMIVRPFRKDGPIPAVSFPSYFVGKYADNKNQSLAIANKRKRNSYKDPALSHVNTEAEKSIYLLLDPDQSDDTQVHCQKHHNFVNPESWIMTFNLMFVTTEANLLIRFGNQDCDAEGVEVNFYKMKKVIVSNYGEKANFLAAPIKWETSDGMITGTPFWIIFHDGVLRVGKGKELSLANQLIFFESRKHSKLSHFYYNKMFSSSLYLSNIQLKTPSEKILGTIKLMEDTPIFNGAASYFEEYTQGTPCGASGQPRKVEVEYKCAKNGEFMKIEDIKEPSTCVYHLTVGSNLLCPDEYKRSHKNEELSSKISCVV